MMHVYPIGQSMLFVLGIPLFLPKNYASSGNSLQGISIDADLYHADLDHKILVVRLRT